MCKKVPTFVAQRKYQRCEYETQIVLYRVMNRVLLIIAVIFSACVANAQHIGSQYRLKRVVEVPGRQGIAADKDFFYVSDTRGLYKFDRNWKPVKKRVQERNADGTFSDPLFLNPDKANHFGDIDVHDGRIYTGNEHFNLGRGHNISIDIYDAATLDYIESIPWCPESGQVEVSGVAVDRERKLVWLSDWVDSRYVYAYSLETGRYYTKVQCRPEPYWCQGIFIADGKMLLSADDGEAAYHIADNLYIMDIAGAPFTGLTDGTEPVRKSPWEVETDKKGNVVTRKGKVAAGAAAGRVELLREMTDFRRAGEIEGLCIDPVNDDLLVLSNRGTRIVLGMSQGPLSDEGYTREIHEVYIYEKIK